MVEKFPYTISKIRRILNSCGDSPVSLSDIEFTSITNSSLEILPGGLFVPLIAERDGHDFILDALNKNAAGFLCNKDHPIIQKIDKKYHDKMILVEDTWKALADLARFHRNRFAPFIIGITGSSGKTTTKELLGYAISHFGDDRVVITEKNYNNEIGLPFTLFRITDRTEIVVLEMGMNHRGEIARLTSIAGLHWAMITNVGSAHIENLKSPKNIALEKSDIIRNSKPDSRLYYPEDILFPKIIQKSARKQYSLTKPWSLKSIGITIKSKHKNGYKLSYKDIDFDWNQPGDKILSNLIGVFTVAIDLGIDPAILIENIQKYQPVGGRFKLIGSFYQLIDDSYNANPESMMSSIEAAKQIADGKNIYCVLGDMKELGNYSKSYHIDLGKFIGKLGISGLFTFGRDSRWIGDGFNHITKQLGTSTPDRIISKHYQDSDDDIQEIIQNIQDFVGQGSYILLKGSRSMRMERIVEKILAATESKNE
ncbi:UDP-N-acetylmuramoyl-tripeptide--D-alanyl-D-alanine ligase [Leptospira sp. GIMC2001]|uniref:UDP-N-acetylmuramoyl-tripeptide--D-alanyl-D- alanine ligase n=1 Tax=Leptospira sp. GIMC2001 TaxID=1513297 RepID=UPI00234A48CD|nr:UDP-N-acetylmuramoyl-tripeptide--D-alanyl-D-alanine ligase [Leptospira sp. GIMC2001]WCL47988.1 UDP-N-acetylmuramoyl-tripeptide--D-alanyl-D-alanine ligase [Leptospira sp. GIMC2001]